MNKFIKFIKALLGINPPRLNIDISRVKVKLYNSQYYFIITISINNTNNSEIDLSPNIKNNFRGNRIANEVIKDSAVHFNGHIIEPTTEFLISEPTKISANSKSIIKNLVYKTNLQSDIELEFTDTNGGLYLCKYRYSDFEINKKPKANWLIQ